MKPTIEDIWYGNITPSDSCGAHDPVIDHLVYLIEKNRTALDATLTPSQKELLVKYADCHNEYLTELSARAFQSGFCLAGHLFTEALIG